MKTRPFFRLLLSTAAISVFGCTMNDIDQVISTNENQLDFRDSDNSFLFGGINGEDTITDLTILGPPRSNPYTVENFTLAYNELYDPDTITLPITHFYIKFTPSTHDELEEIANSELNIVEFPLDREIIHLGDFYLEQGARSDEFIPFYAVVSITDSIPAIPYTVLSELHLESSDEQLVRHALTRQGYDPDDIGYSIKIYEDPDNGGGGGGGGGSIYTTNSCGCQVYSDIRRPGGCIKVKDEKQLILSELDVPKW